MASSSSTLPYAAYSSHRRGQSTSSAIFDRDGTASSSSSSSGNGPFTSNANVGAASNLHRPTISVSKAAPATATPASSKQDAPPPLRRMQQQGQGRGQGNGHSMGTNGGGPPPLRSISSLRMATPASTQSSSSSAKDNEIKNVDSVPSTALSPTRRSVSSSLAVPSLSKAPSTSFSSASHDDSNASSLGTNGHSKRDNYSSSKATNATLHSRSASSSTLPPNLPQHMSTAQRLRSVNSSVTPTGSSSNASSPSMTPRGLSPSLEAMMGYDLPLQSSPQIPFDVDTIGRKTAYRPGFQPKGSYRIRTDEFTAARERRKEGKSGLSSIYAGEESKARTELESQRLERRLEKLLALHYESIPISIDSIPSWLPSALRKTRQMAEEERRIRDEEMRVVKWEEDSTRKICPLCQTPFSLSVRKHHCRLCGRIICASPHLSLPTSGFDATISVNDGKVDEMKCSSLMIGDGKGGTIIKDMPKWEIGNGAREVTEGGKRGIRICRECRETILHRQYMLDDGSVPAYLRLYEALITLQKEIEQSLPEFTEMVLGLQKQDAAAALGTVTETSDDVLSPSRSESLMTAASSIAATKVKNKNSLALQRDAAQARKQLLANFANYDLVAKKIRNLDDGGNASLSRIKVAIWTKANLFLQQNMFPLQSLPKLSSAKKDKKKAASGTNTPNSESGDGYGEQGTIRPFRALLGETHKGSSTTPGSSASTTSRPDAKADARAVELVEKDPVAAKESLAVLEQQLSLVREYAASAAKARKFQDAKALNSSAQDLEAEIARLRKLGIS